MLRQNRLFFIQKQNFCDFFREFQVGAYANAVKAGLYTSLYLHIIKYVISLLQSEKYYSVYPNEDSVCTSRWLMSCQAGIFH